MAEAFNTCEDFAAKAPPTNGDKIIAGGMRELAKVFMDFENYNKCHYCINFIGGNCKFEDRHAEYDEGGWVEDENCIDGIEAWLNAPAESQLNDAIQNLIKDGAKTAIDIHEAAYAPDINDGTMADCVAENAKSGGEK
jgi:hypothetical protein